MVRREESGVVRRMEDGIVRRGMAWVKKGEKKVREWRGEENGGC